MKKFTYAFLKGMLIFLIQSCDYGDLNTNPNAPSAATLPSLLAGAEGVIAYTVGSDVSQFTNIFSQHLTGTSLQAAAWDRYNVDAEAGSPFNFFYSGPMQDLVTMIETAAKQNSPGYEGVGKVLLAYSLGTMTSLYGDIPFQEAFKGATNPYPKFDKQELIYSEIQKMLDEGIVLMKSSSITSNPGNDDFIYKGDMNKWIAAAYTLKARYFIHLTKIDAGATAKALAALYDGGAYRGIVKGNDCDFPFGSGPTEVGPWNQQVQRRNDFRLGKNFADLLQTPTKDLRLSAFALPNATGGYSGSKSGQGDAADSQIGPYFTSTASRVSLITYTEAKFIEAEARLLINPDDPGIEPALQAGIESSVSKVTAGSVSADNISAFVRSRGTLTGTKEGKIKQIITQKYIALFTQPEPWNDWRRTGYPELSPSFGGVNGLNPSGLIPRRLPVPLSERLNNPNAPKDEPNLQTPRFYLDK